MKEKRKKIKKNEGGTERKLEKKQEDREEKIEVGTTFG